MDMLELQSRVGAILAIEERQPIDWQRVDLLTLQLKRELLDATDTPEIVNHFLDDTDIRRRPGEEAYAERQRAELRRFVATGEHDPGKTIPLWTCGVALAVAAALIGWLLS
jgi:hypothetical protein